MKVISITNQKGGVGKTTVSVNLASSLAELGRKILLIDLDPQGNATTSLGFSRNELFSSVYEVLLEDMSIKNAVFPTIQENLFILPANENLPGAEITLAGKPDRSHILKYIFNNNDLNYDYILIDCPPSLGVLTLNALTASDGVIIPMQAEFLALEGLTQLLKTLVLVRENLNESLGIFGVLFTMYDGRTRLAKEVENEVRSFFGNETKVFETVIPRTIRLAEAPSHGLPINIYANSSNGAQAFSDLALEVLNVAETSIGQGLESPDTTVTDPGSGPYENLPGAPDHTGDLGERNTGIGYYTESPPAQTGL